MVTRVREIRERLQIDPDPRPIRKLRFHVSRQRIGFVFGQLQLEIVHSGHCRAMHGVDRPRGSRR